LGKQFKKWSWYTLGFGWKEVDIKNLYYLPHRLRREYTGEWVNDKKSGRGTMYFKNEDRYDGYWLNDLPHGEGRMIYHNGDIYEGQWSLGKKSGYGVLTK